MAKRSGLARWAGIAVEGYTLTQTQTSHGVVHVLPVRGHKENGTYDQYVDRMKRTAHETFPGVFSGTLGCFVISLPAAWGLD